MIVRPASGSVHLITQPDHAAMAGRIMAHCVQLADLARRPSIIHAITEHDNGWREPDETPAIDPATGRVADFITARADVRQGVWRRGVARLQDDPWAAALVAQHAVAVYDRFRPLPEWKPFFVEMEASRDQLVRAAGLGLDDLLREYVFVRLGDLVSLTFCTGWTDTQHCNGWSVQFDGARVAVQPDLFGGRRIPFEVSGRTLPAGRFTSDAGLRAALRDAPLVVLRGHVSGPDAL